MKQWLNIKDLVSSKRNIFQGKLEDAHLPLAWNEAIKEVHPRAQPYTTYHNFHNNILYIKVRDSLWIGELDIQKEELKKRLNAERKKPIQTIRFIVG